MIAKNDLRIGNVVDCYSYRLRISQLTIDYATATPDTEGAFLYKDMQPIPLTPSILEGCGFVKWKELHFQQWGYVQRNVIIEVNDDGTILYIHEPNITLIITTVHQLQNLFYCLCGEELIIDLLNDKK